MFLQFNTKSVVLFRIVVDELDKNQSDISQMFGITAYLLL